MHTNHPILTLRADDGQEMVIQITTRTPDISRRDCLIGERKLTATEFDRIADFAFFSGELSATWKKAGDQAAEAVDWSCEFENIVCQSEDDFFTHHRCSQWPTRQDSVAQMIRELAAASPDIEAAANKVINQWRQEDGYTPWNLPETLDGVLHDRMEEIINRPAP
jgi:hypothetical protein